MINETQYYGFDDEDGEEEEERRDLGPVVGTLTWKGEEFQLFSGVTLLGKAPYAGGQFIKLDHKSISDKHATITYDDGVFKLADIFSTNGTYVPDVDGNGNATFRKLGNDHWVIPNDCEIRFGVIKTYFKRVTGKNSFDYEETSKVRVGEGTCEEIEYEQKKFEESRSKITTQDMNISSNAPTQSTENNVNKSVINDDVTVANNDSTVSSDAMFASTKFNFELPPNTQSPVASVSISATDANTTLNNGKNGSNRLEIESVDTEPFEASQSPVALVSTQPSPRGGMQAKSHMLVTDDMETQAWNDDMGNYDNKNGGTSTSQVVTQMLDDDDIDMEDDNDDNRTIDSGDGDDMGVEKTQEDADKTQLDDLGTSPAPTVGYAPITQVDTDTPIEVDNQINNLPSTEPPATVPGGHVPILGSTSENCKNDNYKAGGEESRGIVSQENIRQATDKMPSRALSSSSSSSLPSSSLVAATTAATIALGKEAFILDVFSMDTSTTNNTALDDDSGARRVANNHTTVLEGDGNADGDDGGATQVDDSEINGDDEGDATLLDISNFKKVNSVGDESTSTLDIEHTSKELDGNKSVSILEESNKKDIMEPEDTVTSRVDLEDVSVVDGQGKYEESKVTHDHNQKVEEDDTETGWEEIKRDITKVESTDDTHDIEKSLQLQKQNSATENDTSNAPEKNTDDVNSNEKNYFHDTTTSIECTQMDLSPPSNIKGESTPNSRKEDSSAVLNHHRTISSSPKSTEKKVNFNESAKDNSNKNISSFLHTNEFTESQAAIVTSLGAIGAIDDTLSPLKRNDQCTDINGRELSDAMKVGNSSEKEENNETQSKWEEVPRDAEKDVDSGVTISGKVEDVEYGIGGCGDIENNNSVVEEQPKVLVAVASSSKRARGSKTSVIASSDPAKPVTETNIKPAVADKSEGHLEKTNTRQTAKKSTSTSETVTKSSKSTGKENTAKESTPTKIGTTTAAISTRARRNNRSEEVDGGDADDVSTRITKSTRSSRSTKTPTPSSSSSSTEVIGSADNADDVKIKLIFSVVQPGREEKAKAKSLGLEIVDNPMEATHAITVPNFTRTPKLMAAIEGGTLKYIVKLTWLEESATKGSMISLSSKSNYNKYAVIDKEKENLWKFNLQRTLSIDSRGSLFKNIVFYVTDYVYGQKAPKREEILTIVESGAGVLLDSSNKFPTALNTVDNDAIIVILSSEDAISSLESKKVEHLGIPTSILQYNAMKLKGIYSLVEFLFVGILRQKLSYDENIVSNLPTLHVGGSKRKRNATIDKSVNNNDDNDGGKVSKTTQITTKVTSATNIKSSGKSKTKAAIAEDKGTKKTRKK